MKFSFNGLVLSEEKENIKREFKIDSITLECDVTELASAICKVEDTLAQIRFAKAKNVTPKADKEMFTKEQIFARLYSDMHACRFLDCCVKTKFNDVIFVFNKDEEKDEIIMNVEGKVRTTIFKGNERPEAFEEMLKDEFNRYFSEIMNSMHLYETK